MAKKVKRARAVRGRGSIKDIILLGSKPQPIRVVGGRRYEWVGIGWIELKAVKPK